jgi:hypothetical protein
LTSQTIISLLCPCTSELRTDVERHANRLNVELHAVLLIIILMTMPQSFM